MTKVVTLPIEVPDGEYCWPPSVDEELGQTHMCQYLEVDGGNAYCYLHFDVIKISGNIIQKDPICRDLDPICRD